MLLAVCIAALAALVAAGATAGEKGHGSMSGSSGGMKMGGQGMMKMGDKVFEGKIGSLHGEARLVDMKAQMAKAKVSVKMMANMKNTHHLSLALTDPKTKKAVTEGKGTVTVTGPDKKQEKADFMVMEGHFGADVNLPAPGKYTFQVQVDAGGQKGDATFGHTVK